MPLARVIGALGSRVMPMMPPIVPWMRSGCRQQRRQPNHDTGLDWFDNVNIAWTLRLRLRLGRHLFGRSNPFNRGLQLLLENLSPDQRGEFLRRGYFHVVGGRTQRLYRISKGRQVNVHQLDDHNRKICIWCFYPKGNLVEGDVMLAQKLALELFEDEALAVANRLSNYCEPLGC